MKNKIITGLIAAAALIAATPSAEAQHHRHRHGHHERIIFISGYHPCGTPIYSERYLVRYDRCDRPVYGVRIVRHHPRHARPVRGGYDRRWAHAHRGYPVPPVACPPPHRGGTAIRIRF